MNAPSITFASFRDMLDAFCEDIDAESLEYLIVSDTLTDEAVGWCEEGGYTWLTPT